MVTSAERKAEIERRLEEIPEEERARVVFVQPSKKPKVTGYRVIDPETGELGASRFREEFGDVELVSIEDPRIEASRRRYEEKEYEREMAEKRAETELKRRERGLPPVPLDKESTRILEEKLKERVEEVPTREQERQERILATLERQRQFAMLTESQQRVVRTLVKQGREVRFERGVIITEEAGRKVIITPEALAIVPVTAEVDIKELERWSKEIRARREIEVKPFIEPKRAITPEEKRIVDFERRAKELEKRERKFYASEGFKRIEALAAKFPLIGKTEIGREVLTTLMGYPIALGGFIVSTFEKLMLTGEATTIPELREGVRRELLKTAPKEALEVYKRPATYITAALFALPVAAGMVLAGRPIARVRVGKIADVKTTIIKFRGRGAARALGVKVGKRAVVVGVGEPALLPPRGIIPVQPIAIVPAPPTAIVPRGIIPPKPVLKPVVVYHAGDVPPTITMARGGEVYGFTTRELAEGWRIKHGKKAVYKITTERYIQDPAGGYTRPIPAPERVLGYEHITSQKPEYIVKGIKTEKAIGIKIEPPALAKVRAREVAQRAREQTIQDVISGVIDIKDVRPSIRKEAAKRIREVALERRGIKPLDITPIGIFAPRVPLYEPPALAKVRVKEAAQRAREQLIEDVLEGRIPIGEVRPSIRKAVRKELAQRAKWEMEKRGIRPRELFFDIKKLPLPYWKIVRPRVKVKPPKPRIVKPRPPEEIVTREGLVLILKPPKVKVVSKQEQVALAKLERKTLTATQRQALAKTQMQRQRVTLGRSMGTESIQRGRLAFALGIIPARRIVKPVSVVDVAQAQKIAQAQRQAQAEAQAKGEVSISGLEDIQISALTEAQVQAQAQEQQSVVEQAIEEVQKEQLIEKVPSPLRLQLLFKTPEKEKVKLIKSIGFGEEGYDVYVKRKQLKKGKGSYRSRGFKKANVEPLSREAALGLGVSRVDTFTNRSFFIEEAKKKIKRRRQDLINRWRALSHKFRASKKKPNVLVEESAYAIDHPVEVAGIPYEAARLRKAGLLQQRITFIKTQKKKQQLQTRITEQISFIKSSSPKQSQSGFLKTKGGSPIKFL